MMRGLRFHGDPHPGNVLILDDGTLGLIDFGMTARLDAFGRSFVTELFAALHLQDPGLLYEALLSGGSIDAGADRDRIERALAAYLAVSGQDGLGPDTMVGLLRTTADLGVSLPDQASAMMRAMATLMGTLHDLDPDYPFVDRVIEAGGAEARAMVHPGSVRDMVEREAASLAPLIKRAPRHLDRIAGQLERGELVIRASLFEQPRDVEVLERLVNKVLLTFIGIGLMALSVLAIRTTIGPTIVVQDVYLAQVLGWLGMFFGSTLVLRVLLDILRAPRPD